MANLVCEVLVTENPLTRPSDDLGLDHGAVVDFFGIVRRLENEREIEGISYESNLSMAEHQLRSIAEMAAVKFSLGKIVIHHRVGFVRIGEPSLFLQVMARHRAAAFDASKWIVDELKKKVPIWKRPIFEMESNKPGSAIPVTAK